MNHHALKILIVLVASLSIPAIASTGHAQTMAEISASTAEQLSPPAAPGLGVELALEPPALGPLLPAPHASPSLSALLPTLVPPTEAPPSFSSTPDPTRRLLGDGARVIEQFVGLTLSLEFDVDPSVGGWLLRLGTAP